MKPSINDVLIYWSKCPIHSLEFSGEPNSKDYFDSIDHLRWSENELWAKTDFYDLPGDTDTRLLDAGCGIGVFTRFYARRGFQVTALDLTDVAVQITRKSLELNHLKAQVLQGSVEALPFDNNSFDYIVSNGVIHHTSETEQAIKEFYRVLKPGGKASVAIYHRNWLLRNPFWPIVRLMIPFLIKSLPGREKMFKAKTPEQFVNVYDGNDTPIVKMYTKKDAVNLFNLFTVLKLEQHYFPVRFIRGIKRGEWLHYLLDHYCGCLLYALLEKPMERKG